MGILTSGVLVQTDFTGLRIILVYVDKVSLFWSCPTSSQVSSCLSYLTCRNIYILHCHLVAELRRPKWPRVTQ